MWTGQNTYSFRFQTYYRIKSEAIICLILKETFFSVVTSVRMPSPKLAPSNPIPAVSTGYYMSVIIFIMAGFAGVAFFTIILLMCLKRRKRWKRRKRYVNSCHFLEVINSIKIHNVFAYYFQLNIYNLENKNKKNNNNFNHHHDQHVYLTSPGLGVQVPPPPCV